MGKFLATYGKPRFLGIVELGGDISENAGFGGAIVAVSHRGEELASVMGPLNEEQERAYRGMKTISEHPDGQARGGDPVVSDLEFVRVASDVDLSRWASQKAAEDGILTDAQEMVECHSLELKLIDAETMIDGKKLFFYFTSETRVDFRTLVKDMARKFRTRIELRQMGVRDEARIIRGMASCGLPCCCSYWLNQFAPIGIKMVKEQNIALNPAKISGICGRLMCCMSFEHKVYKNLWAGLPGPGSKIKTPLGNYVVSSMDISREAVRCHKPSGGDVLVPVARFQDFRASVMNGEEWTLPDADAGEWEESSERKKECACRRNMEVRKNQWHMGGVSRLDAPCGEKTPQQADGVSQAGRVGAGDDGASEDGRHLQRRRGHRGGRKNRQDLPESPRLSEQARDGLANCPEPPSGGKESAGDAAPARAVRSRRRRRRPRQGPPAAAGS
ncbi:MAG: hypothetical protein LBQ36_07515 [Synergistaceae bacterium]|nr:hypothetical protein [Synergistaceae bacterium]